MSAARHLVVFVRYPFFGVGKRRLAAGMGDAFAMRFQRVVLAHLVRRLGRDARWQLWLAVTPDRSGPWPSGAHIIGQGKGDLGKRLVNVISGLPPGPALVIGSDVPGISRDIVAEAFQTLGGRHAVIGPSSDGGYWSIGLRRVPREILPFANVRWSTPHARADTLANLEGCSVKLLSALDDIDDAGALARAPTWDQLVSHRS